MLRVDRIHAIRDAILKIVEHEFSKQDFSPIEILAGELLALKSLTETAHALKRPQSLLALDESVDCVLFDIGGLADGPRTS